MNTLFEIKNDAIRKWQDAETDEERLQVKEQVDIAIKEQSIDVINALKNMQFYAKALKDAENEFKEKRQAIEQKLEKAKEYIRMNMISLGYEKIETPLGSLQIRKCPASVEIIDEQSIPAEYVKEEIVRKVDKSKILENFKNTGEVINGTTIVLHKTTLVLK